MDLLNYQPDLIFTELVTGFNIQRNLTIGMRYNVGLCEDLIWFTELQNKEFVVNKQLITLFRFQIKLLRQQLKQLIKDAKETIDLDVKKIKLVDILDLERDIKELLEKYG